MRRLVGAAPVARLGTIDPDGRPHAVPFCFVLTGDVVYSAVDHKPKTSPRLRRFDNIRANPDVVVLVDHYEEDWSRLWWVRLSGRAREVVPGPEADRAVDLLVGKYPQYGSARPAGPVLAVEITQWRGWAASEVLGPTSP